MQITFKLTKDEEGPRLKVDFEGEDPYKLANFLWKLVPGNASFFELVIKNIEADYPEIYDKLGRIYDEQEPIITSDGTTKNE